MIITKCHLPYRTQHTHTHSHTQNVYWVTVVMTTWLEVTADLLHRVGVLVFIFWRSQRVYVIMQECDWIPHEIWDIWSKHCVCREDYIRGGREREGGRGEREREREKREHTCCLFSISHLLSTFRAYTLSLLFILATYSPSRYNKQTHIWKVLHNGAPLSYGEWSYLLMCEN